MSDGNESTFFFFITYRIMILPKPNIFILDSGIFKGVFGNIKSNIFAIPFFLTLTVCAFFNALSPQKVKKIVTSLPAALAPFAIIIAATALSNSPLNSTIVVPLAV